MNISHGSREEFRRDFLVVGVVVSLSEIDAKDRIVIADEVDAGLAERRVKQHVGLRCLTPSAMLAEVKLRQCERVL